jgi:hypothetical protein
VGSLALTGGLATFRRLRIICQLVHYFSKLICLQCCDFERREKVQYVSLLSHIFMILMALMSTVYNPF